MAECQCGHCAGFATEPVDEMVFRSEEIGVIFTARPCERNQCGPFYRNLYFGPPQSVQNAFQRWREEIRAHLNGWPSTVEPTEINRVPTAWPPSGNPSR